jgi:predicted nucleic acid-binding protein
MIYLDTNVFLYAIQRHEKYGNVCATILENVASKKLNAICSTVALAEMIGALQKINIELKKQKEPLVDMGEAFDIILNYPITWLDISPVLIRKSLEYSSMLFGVDCIHRESMELNDIKEIISADKDFDTIPGIKRIDPLNYK